MGREPVAASTASISASFASRFMRSTQRMTSTRWAFQPGSMPRPGVRPMAAASLAVGASAIRCWTSGRAPNFAAWYRCSDVSNAQGPAAIGTDRGWKLLNAPQATRVKRNEQTWSLA